MTPRLAVGCDSDKRKTVTTVLQVQSGRSPTAILRSEADNYMVYDRFRPVWLTELRFTSEGIPSRKTAVVAAYSNGSLGPARLPPGPIHYTSPVVHHQHHVLIGPNVLQWIPLEYQDIRIEALHDATGVIVDTQ